MEISDKLKEICTHFNTTLESCQSTSRLINNVFARFTCYRIMKDNGISKKDIAKIFNRTESTINAGLRVQKIELETNKQYFSYFMTMKIIINN